jgi:hypothetical protein
MMKKEIIVGLLIVVALIISSCGTLTYTGNFCEDGIKDRDETDVDCGGQYCRPCLNGMGCDLNEDCESGICDSTTKLCAGGARSEVDTDGDGYTDQAELIARTDPNDATDYPSSEAEDTCSGIDNYCTFNVDGNEVIVKEGTVESTYADGYGQVDVMVPDITSIGCVLHLNPYSTSWMNEGTESTMSDGNYDHTLTLTSVSDTYDTCTFIIDGRTVTLNVGSSTNLGSTVSNPPGTIITVFDAKTVDIEHGEQDVCEVGVGSEVTLYLTGGDIETASLRTGDHTVTVEDICKMSLKGYPDMFFDDSGEFTAELVVGANAMAEDVIAVTNIATPLSVSAVKLDVDISDPYAQDLILVGTQCYNDVINEVLGLDETTCATSITQEDTAIIKLIELDTNKILIVSGYAPIDTRLAGQVLSNYDDYVLEGTEVIVDTSDIRNPVIS